MGEAEVGMTLRETMLVILKLGGPALLVALAVGFVVSLVQAVTQIHEATLTFIPKVLVIGGVLAMTGPFMLATLTDYAHTLFDRVIEVGSK